MSLTATSVLTLKDVLDEANLNRLADALAKVKLGSVMTVIDEDTGTVSAATSITLKNPALMVQSVEVVTAPAMQAATGSRFVGRSDATASATVCKLSADGLTLTFEGQVTRVKVVYLPRPNTALTASW